ncbi:hypothetical protein, partial [Leptospira santarosai]|uniref:hypothetical protein n=1 Tax=Leptospira santarosai TaxID=28183 RepID=UPI001E3EA4E7
QRFNRIFILNSIAESGSSYKLRLFALFLRFERTFYNEVRATAIHGGRTLILWEFLIWRPQLEQ